MLARAFLGFRCWTFSLGLYGFLFVGESHCSGNGNRTFDKDPTASEAQQLISPASTPVGTINAEPLKVPHFAIEPVTVPSLNAAPVSIDRVQKNTIGISFGCCTQKAQAFQYLRPYPKQEWFLVLGHRCPL